jgi:hypothetical protein
MEEGKEKAFSTDEKIGGGEDSTEVGSVDASSGRPRTASDPPLIEAKPACRESWKRGRGKAEEERLEKEDDNLFRGACESERQSTPLHAMHRG